MTERRRYLVLDGFVPRTSDAADGNAVRLCSLAEQPPADRCWQTDSPGRTGAAARGVSRHISKSVRMAFVVRYTRVDVHSPSGGMVPMRGTDFRAIALQIGEATSARTLDRIEAQLRAAKADSRRRLLLHKLEQRRQELRAREEAQ